MRSLPGRRELARPLLPRRSGAFFRHPHSTRSSTPRLAAISPPAPRAQSQCSASSSPMSSGTPSSPSRILTPPAFTDSLAPLSKFIREAQRRAPTLRLVLVLDEFDELPRELYTRGDIGDAFFLTL